MLVRRRAVLDGEATGLLLERDGVAMSAIAMLFRWSSMRGVLVTHLYPRSALTMGGVFYLQHKPDCRPPACPL